MTYNYYKNLRHHSEVQKIELQIIPEAFIVGNYTCSFKC